MARIAFILLCHKDPDMVVKQAERLTAACDYIAIHYDASAPRKEYDLIRAALSSNANVVFPRRRVRCGWGEWSLVQATLNTVKTALDGFPRATHFYLLSGDCMSIKLAEYAHAFLDAHDVDHIESFDFFGSDWIKTGLKEERLIYRHYFNERRNTRLFYGSVEVQRRLGLKRAVPDDVDIMVGSQWWCLRRTTIEAILDLIRARRDLLRFFRTTWIPDETFFQTLVRHVVPRTQISNRSLTFLMFSDYGMPVTFYNDHYDLLLSQDFLFARKISEDAKELKRRLGALYVREGVNFEVSNEGQRLYEFLTGRGRVGQRFAPRFWEKGNSLGSDRVLLMVVCKKWHVAKRLVEQVKQFTEIPALEYLFDEEASPLPDLGGLQHTLEKRGRHKRALMRMLFDYYDSDALLICLDPKNLDIIHDFSNARSTTRVLEVDCEFSDSFLIGHAQRIGLLGEHTPSATVARLLPTVRNDVLFEADRLRNADISGYYRIREVSSQSENAAELVKFLDIPESTAHKIASLDHLFAD